MQFSAEIDLKTTHRQSYRYHTSVLMSVSIEYVTDIKRINTTGEGKCFSIAHIFLSLPYFLPFSLLLIQWWYRKIIFISAAAQQCSHHTPHKQLSWCAGSAWFGLTLPFSQVEVNLFTMMTVPAVWRSLLNDMLIFLSPVPGPPDSSHHSLISAPWFTNEPVLCSMMPVSI